MKNAKMADILLVAGSQYKILYCASWWTVYVYKILFAYDKVGGGAAILIPGHFRLATPTKNSFTRTFGYMPSTNPPSFSPLGPALSESIG